MFPCTRCQFESREYYKLISHYRFVHSNENDFFLTCGVDGCEKKYSLVRSLLQHMKRRHKDFHEIQLARYRHQNREPEILRTFHSTGENDGLLEEIVENDDLEEQSVDFDKNFAKFLLKLREKYKLPANAIASVVDELCSMVETHHALLSKDLMELLSNIGLSAENILEVKSLLSQTTEIESTCKAFNSEAEINKVLIGDKVFCNYMCLLRSHFQHV